MTKLKELLYEAGANFETSTASEIKEAVNLICEAEDLTEEETANLYAIFHSGPLHDGEIPSKQGRDMLLSKGLVEKIVVKGDDGFNACTHKGAWVYRIQTAL